MPHRPNCPAQTTPPPLDADTEKRRRRHADAQDRYRARNLAETRTKARLRMERLRSERQMSEEKAELAALRRRKTDADYRERCRKKKFIAKFGERAFITQYLPLHDIFGEHIVGKKFVWSDEVGRKERRSKAKSKTAAARGATEESA